jgi:DNA-damage-inducible protein D
MTNKTLKIDIKLDKLARKVAQANKNEVMQISQEKMNDKTIDEFIKKLEEKSHRDENGIEFWYARQLQEILEYVSWDKFQLPLKKAKNACQDSGIDVDCNFSHVGKIVETGVATKEINDYKLSRYACYLIAQNADTRKKIVAFAQTYFAVQTRRQEIDDLELNKLSENEKRIHLRHDIKKHNNILSSVAKGAGVVEPLDYAMFQNAGYKGLYDGKTKQDIAKHKGLSKKDDILDHMGSEELGANIFRITQTAAKIEREKIKGKQQANIAHFEVGKKIRQTIEEIGGTMPENLPVAENIKRLEQKQKKLAKSKLKNTIDNATKHKPQ